MPKRQCSFCKKPENEVKALVGNDGGPYICNKCSDLVHETLYKDAKEHVHEEAEKPLLPPKEIKAALDEHVIGQKKLKRDIAVAVYRHYLRREYFRQGGSGDNVRIDKSNVLILGPSGSGKTEVVRAFTELLGVPLHIADANKLTQTGYVGDDVESLLQGLVAAAGGDIEKAQWGVCVIDEVDKIARKSGRGASGYRDVTGEGVQQALLKLIEGTKMNLPMGTSRMVSVEQPTMMFDTTNVLFICLGSFEGGLDEIVKRRVNKGNKMGFGVTQKKRDLSKTDIYELAEEDDVLEFGIIPELKGRLPIMTTTIPLTEDQLIRILTEPKHALIKQLIALFAMDSIQLTFEEDALRAIARKVMSKPTGARALRSIVEDITIPLTFDYAGNGTNVEAIIVTEATVMDNQPPIIKHKGGGKVTEKVASQG
jgi:ATP-dependent Clp protease ATP-binding subunit ClpX